MGHHLTDDGQFKSDRHPDLPAGKIVLSFRDPHAQLGLWVTAIDYRAHDPELSADMVTALSRLGSAPPRAAVEDAWAWSLAREQGIDPRETVRAFVRVHEDGYPILHVIGSQRAIEAVESVVDDEAPEVFRHALVAGDEAPPRAATDDGRPDFDGFLLALRAEGQWSAALHAEDKTGQAAADQRALHELAQHVEAVGKKLGFLPVTRPAARDRMTETAAWLRALASSEDATHGPSTRALTAAADFLDQGKGRPSEGDWALALTAAFELGMKRGVRLPEGRDAESLAGAHAAGPPWTPPPRTKALAKWLREVADDVANLRNSSDRTNAECVSNLRATVDILPNGPLCESIHNLADQVASGRIERGTTDVTTIANLRAAADALERGMRGMSLDMMEAHDAPLLAPDKP